MQTNQHTQSAREIMARLHERFPDIELPTPFQTFLAEQEKSGHLLRRLVSNELLVTFLQRESSKQGRLASFLDVESRLAQRINYHTLLKLDADDILAYLIDHFAYVFDYQQVALDADHSTGFNTHGSEHVGNVTRNALSLVRQRNPIRAGNTYEKEAVIGGLFHDIGNLLQRRFHGLYGVYLLTQLFEDVDFDAATLDSFLTVLEVVMFHEVEFGSQQALFDRLSPATLAVIIADKTDVSFRRVSAKSNVEEAAQDAHVLVNLLVADSTIRRKAGKAGRFVWKVDFRAKFDSNQADLFSRLLKATGRVKYPKEWTDIYEESNIEYLFVFQSTFLSIYLSRLYFAIRAVFTLFPSVQEFDLIVDDAERRISLKRVFQRKEYRALIVTLGKLFYREEWGKTYLAKVLE